MQQKLNFCIVIPCFNEGKKFHIQEYSQYLMEYKNSFLCFINDGSSDNTINILNDLHYRFPEQVEVISYSKNLGKAEAVRKGILYCNENCNFEHIAYLDADLAVSLEECTSLIKYFDKDIVFCFASRILKIGSIIERKRSRFLIGRFIATLISEMLSLKVYDTQCGCKLFTKEVSAVLFASPFISRWLFDVEIFFRILKMYGKEDSLKKMLEVPIKKWIDQGDSKVKATYFFNLWFDLYQIKKTYK